jgi:predicted chitinase
MSSISNDKRIDAALRSLQKAVGAAADGAWGSGSQEVLISSGKKINYNWDMLKKHFGPFQQHQVDGFNSILQAINEYGGQAINPLYVAYMLATTWHETGVVRNGKMDRTMQPVREIGRGAGRPYGKKLNIRREPYYGLDHLYWGRGYVQLTWIDNYAKMRDLLKVDFINNPDLALVPKHAANIMIEGMLRGIFTGLSLSRCFRYGSNAEFTYARRIINGTDRDSLIAGYAVNFLECLKTA